MKGAKIKSAASITVLDSFYAVDQNALLKNNYSNENPLIQPNYKDYMPMSMLRRASKMNKMSMAATYENIKLADVETLGAIIVGSGLGCLKDTEKFLEVYIEANVDSLLPPLSFIQSGHNAMSGQIALALKNQHYNMTHVQKGLSFEYALMDALLKVHEGTRDILVGAIDEKIDLLDDLSIKLNAGDDIVGQISEGASFMILDKTDQSGIEVIACQVTETENWEESLNEILNSFDISTQDLSQVLVGYNLCQRYEVNLPHVVYTDYIGKYFSSSSYGLHLAYDALKNTEKPSYTALINFDDAIATGITILRSV